MRYTILLYALIALLMSACLQVPVHQGNRLKSSELNQIKVGDSKFSIEQKLGSPALNNTLHPHRSTYYEEYEDEASGALIKRGVDIMYDDALRAKSIHHFGFTKKK